MIGVVQNQIGQCFNLKISDHSWSNGSSFSQSIDDLVINHHRLRNRIKKIRVAVKIKKTPVDAAVAISISARTDPALSGREHW